MRSKKILVGVTLVSFLASEFSFGIAPALGQSPVNGGGQVPMPSLSGDGSFGRLLPGPSTPTPYLGVPQPPQQPQQQVTPLRPIAAAAPNMCQPGGARSSRLLRFHPIPPATATAPAQPAALQAAAAEVDELSRIEAAFNVDPVRQFAVPMGLNQPASAQQAGALQIAVQPASQQQPGVPQQRPTAPQEQLLQQPTLGQAML